MENYTNFKISNLIDRYLSNDINESQLYHEFDYIINLNEGVIDNIKDFIKNTKASTEEALIKLVVSIYIKLSEIFKNSLKFTSKIFNILIWIGKKISKFKQRHPTLFKIIIISSIILLLLILSTTNAIAGGKIDINKDLGVDKDHINVLLGWAKDFPTDTRMDSMKTQAMLIDIKDGVIDGPWSKEEILKLINKENNILKSVLQSMQKKGYSDSMMGELLDQMRKSGENLVNFTYQHIKGVGFDSEKINIISK